MRGNKTLLVPLLIALLVAGLFVPAARAGKFHFTSLSFSLGSLIAQGPLVGIGNETAVVTLTARGTVTATCQNSGGKQAPGRNPIAAVVEQTNTFITDEYGRASVLVEASDPTLANLYPSPTPKTAGCPNGNWTVTGVIDGSMNWTSAEIVVRDVNGNEELSLSFTCVTLFENGLATRVNCVES